MSLLQVVQITSVTHCIWHQIWDSRWQRVWSCQLMLWISTQLRPEGFLHCGNGTYLAPSSVHTVLSWSKSSPSLILPCKWTPTSTSMTAAAQWICRRACRAMCPVHSVAITAILACQAHSGDKGTNICLIIWITLITWPWKTSIVGRPKVMVFVIN